MTKILTPDYSNLLYEGGYGDIYKCKENNKIAIKLTRKIESGTESSGNGEINKKIIHRIRGHPNLMKIYGFNQNGSIYMIYLERIFGGKTLANYFSNNGEGQDRDQCQGEHLLNTKIITNILRQILDGLSYLHSNKITHRDIKLNNIIIYRDADIIGDTPLRIKIIDFGLACYGLPCSGVVGTSGYFAPEIITRKFYDSKCDIWSLGCILYYMVCHSFPFFKIYDKQNYIEQINNHTDIKYAEPIWNNVNYGVFKHLCQNMLVYQPENRFSSEDCVFALSTDNYISALYANDDDASKATL